ncbi:Factor arrest protein 11 [Mucor velutinosus]|uniref:Factor arrest protein 11 n=1 Tax=Mucor velutinosus TaxID=708070 RepID=A0AAN7D4L3_9FUNG|nr:Factor arrest protein 11 [Mucor velutinosus]
MSLDDDLSLSFASSMGIGNIQDEYLDRSNLYTDLDQLEKSVDAEFEEYMNRARSFPFKQDNKPLDNVSVHSDYEIVGDNPANQDVDQEDMDDGDNDSWQRYLANRHSDEHYIPLGGPSFSKSHSRSTSPGEYFGARSLPFDYDWQKQTDEEEEQEEEEEEEEEEQIDNNTHSSYRSSSRSRQKTAIQTSLDSRFISLPKSLGIYPKYELPDIELHHPYTQKQTYSNGFSVSSTRQQCSPREQQQRQRQRELQQQLQNAQSDNSDYHQKRAPSSSNTSTESSSHAPLSLYAIEPASPLQFLCEISPKTIYAKVIHLKIENTSSTSVRNFSLFSAKNMLDFEMSEGLVLEHEVVEIKIKIQSSALVQYQRQHYLKDDYPPLSDKILVLIDHRHVNELDVQIDFIALEDPDPEEVQQETDATEELDKERQQHVNEHNLLLSHRPKCRFCALEKGYPLYNL